ncbi:MAG: SEC-C domain-containing protein [Syntrophobacterales bacterium]|nr:SEC-C domain-containing protein [Syntrophobacterales bacterium]
MGFFNKLFQEQPPEKAMKLGRNDLCWCGSGKKYKKCHHESDQKHFSKFYATACKTAL